LNHKLADVGLGRAPAAFPPKMPNKATAATAPPFDRRAAWRAICASQPRRLWIFDVGCRSAASRVCGATSSTWSSPRIREVACALVHAE